MKKPIQNPLLSGALEFTAKSLASAKHPGTICVVNYKGGVGKTTISCLLGYYLASETKKKVLLFDIDPQCSLSLALGFNPEDVNKTEKTIYNLVKPSKWTKIKTTDFGEYVFPVKDHSAPKNLFVIRGSFEVDTLDMIIAQTLAGEGSKYVEQLFLYCKQMLNSFEKEYAYVIVDCPPNKMFLTQAMLRACEYYLAVTIPDAISTYGMPRLFRWVKEIPVIERPRLLGYLLNVINRSGGAPGGKVYSQQDAEVDLRNTVTGSLEPVEKKVLGDDPLVGEVPRLDIIARFLSRRDNKIERHDFGKRTSNQPSVDECMEDVLATILKRIRDYRAEI